jgi:hypothetical protein
MVSEPGRSCTTITAAKEEFAELKKRRAHSRVFGD